MRIFTVLFSLALFSPALWAQSSLGSQFGMLYGLSVPDADNTLPHHLFGIKGAAYLAPALTLGGYYLVSGTSEGSGGEKFDFSVHGVEAAYHIPTGNGDTAIAARAGVSKILTDQSGTKIIFSPYHWGIAVSYDYLLTNWFTMGFEGSYLHAEDGKTAKSGTVYRQDSFNLISFMVTVMVRL